MTCMTAIYELQTSTRKTSEWRRVRAAVTTHNTIPSVQLSRDRKKSSAGPELVELHKCSVMHRTGLNLEMG